MTASQAFVCCVLLLLAAVHAQEISLASTAKVDVGVPAVLVTSDQLTVHAADCGRKNCQNGGQGPTTSTLTTYDLLSNKTIVEAQTIDLQLEMPLFDGLVGDNDAVFLLTNNDSTLPNRIPENGATRLRVFTRNTTTGLLTENTTCTTDCQFSASDHVHSLTLTSTKLYVQFKPNSGTGVGWGVYEYDRTGSSLSNRMAISNSGNPTVDVFGTDFGDGNTTGTSLYPLRQTILARDGGIYVTGHWPCCGPTVTVADLNRILQLRSISMGFYSAAANIIEGNNSVNLYNFFPNPSSAFESTAGTKNSHALRNYRGALAQSDDGTRLYAFDLFSINIITNASTTLVDETASVDASSNTTFRAFSYAGQGASTVTDAVQGSIFPLAYATSMTSGPGGTDVSVAINAVFMDVMGNGDLVTGDTTCGFTGSPNCTIVQYGGSDLSQKTILGYFQRSTTGLSVPVTPIVSAQTNIAVVGIGAIAEAASGEAGLRIFSDFTTAPFAVFESLQNGSSVKTDINIAFQLGELGNGTAYLVFQSDGQNVTYTLDTVTNPATLYNFTFSFGNPTSGPSGAGLTLAPATTITIHGTYTVYMEYQDALGNAAARSPSISFNLDLLADNPSFFGPSSGSRHNTLIPVTYNIPEAQKNPPKLITSGAGSFTFTLVQSGAGSNVSFNINISVPVADAAVTDVLPAATSLAEGSYNFNLTYTDDFDNEGFGTLDNIIVDTSTDAPTLNSPNSTVTIFGDNLLIDYNLPEAATPNSVQLHLSNNTNTYTITLTGASFSNIGPHSLDILLIEADGTPGATYPTIPVGTYTAVFEYQDDLGNPASNVTVAAPIVVNRTTVAPIDVSFAGGNGNILRATQSLQVNFTLPDIPQSESVKIIFQGPEDITALLKTTSVTQGINSITINPSNINTTNSLVESFSSSNATLAARNQFSDGNYTVTVEYVNDINDTAASTQASGDWRFDTLTQPATLTLPSAGTVNSVSVQYSLGETPFAGSVKLEFIHQSGGADVTLDLSTAESVSSSFLPNQDVTINGNNMGGVILSNDNAGNIVPDGAYTVRLSYQDLAGNTAATASQTGLVIDTITQPVTLTAPIAFSSASQLTTVYSSTTPPASPGALNFLYSLGEVGSTGSITLSGLGGGAALKVWPLQSEGLQTGTKNFSVSLVDGSLGGPDAGAVGSVPGALPQGQYVIAMSYADSVPNNAANSASITISIDQVTRSITTFSDPEAAPAGVISTDTASHSSFFNVRIPEAAKNDLVSFNWVQTDGSTDFTVQRTLNVTSTTNLTFTYKILESGFSCVGNGCPSEIPDGTYNVTMSYRDIFDNPVTVGGSSAATQTTSGWIVDTVTGMPTLNLPASGTKNNSFTFNYTLPETPLSGSVRLEFSGSSSVVWTMGDSTNVQFYVPDVSNTSTFPAEIQGNTGALNHLGQYSVLVSYRDQFNNSRASSSVVTNLQVDTESIVPDLNLPVDNSRLGELTISYRIREPPTPNSVKLTITPTSPAGTPTVIQLTDTHNTTQDETFTITPLNVTTSLPAGVTIISGPASLADGVYDVKIEYQDSLINEFAATTRTGIILDAITLKPTIFAPTNGTDTSHPFALTFELPEPPTASSVVLSYTLANGTALTPSTLASVPFSVNFSAISSYPHNFTINPDFRSLGFPDGVISLVITYQDASTPPNNARSSDAVFITSDTRAEPPTLSSPTAGAYTNPVRVTYTIPEAITPGSVQLVWTGTSVGATSVTLNMTNSLSANFSLNPLSLTSAAEVTSATSSSLCQCTFTVSVVYRDALGNTVLDANFQPVTGTTGVSIDTVTAAPTISAPTDGAGPSRDLVLSYNLPDPPEPNSVKLDVTNGSTTQTASLTDVQTVTINLAYVGTGWPAQSGNEIVSGLDSGVTSGTYNLTLRYKDSLSNAEESVTVTGVQFDTFTETPTLYEPVGGVAVSAGSNLTFNYTLPEVPQAGSVHLVFDRNGAQAENWTMIDNQSLAFSYNPNTDAELLPEVNNALLTKFVDGTYDITLEYKDSLGNTKATAVQTNIQLDTATQTPTLTLPADNSNYEKIISIRYTLPEVPSVNTTTLTFTSTTNTSYSVVLLLATTTSGEKTVEFDPSSASTVGVTSVTGVMVADVYTVTLSYRDSSLNTAAGVTSVLMQYGSQKYVRVTFVLSGNQALASNTTQQAELMQQIATATNQPLSRFRFRSAVAPFNTSTGLEGVQIAFDILEPTGTQSGTAAEVKAEFDKQYLTPSSNLRRQSFFLNADPASGTAALDVCVNSLQDVVSCGEGGTTGSRDDEPDNDNTRRTILIIGGILFFGGIIIMGIIHCFRDRSKAKEQKQRLQNISSIEVAATFADIDKNNDGVISPEEFNDYVNSRAGGEGTKGLSAKQIIVGNATDDVTQSEYKLPTSSSTNQI